MRTPPVADGTRYAMSPAKAFLLSLHPGTIGYLNPTIIALALENLIGGTQVNHWH